MSKYFISVQPNFISEDERKAILGLIPQVTTWDTNMPPDHTWYNRYVHYGHMAPELQAYIGPIRQRVKRQIVSDYGITEPLYADTLQVVRWFEGNFQHPHADAENHDGSPHPYPWRAFASIIYLNDEYEGGQIYFPTKGIQPVVKPGTLAFFPGTLEFTHGVKPVTKGMRYTIASFFTFDASKHDGGPI